MEGGFIVDGFFEIKKESLVLEEVLVVFECRRFFVRKCLLGSWGVWEL